MDNGFRAFEPSKGPRGCQSEHFWDVLVQSGGCGLLLPDGPSGLEAERRQHEKDIRERNTGRLRNNRPARE